jgi:PKD repeat protein
MEVNFTADNLLPAVNQTVTLTDLTTGSPTGWNWTITPASFTYVNGTVAASQNPQVQFTSNGLYTVTLAAIKGGCTITKTSINFIHSGTSGLWTGITSSDWNVASNWHNFLVPETATNVLIPSGTTYYPVFDGDLTIGSQIGTLTLQGDASTMTITGNLTILSSK